MSTSGSATARKPSQANSALILGIVSAVCGVLASAPGVVSYAGFVAPVAALLALVAGLRGLREGGQKRTFALTGIVGGVVGTALFLIPISQGVASVTWNTFTSDKGGFTVSMPGKPEETDAGNGSTQVIATGIDASYAVLITDVPANTPADQLFDGMKQGLTNGRTLISEKEAKLGDNPGVQYVIGSVENGQNAQSQVTVYYVGSRVYTLLVKAPQNSFPQGSADRFFSSFKLK